MIKDVAMNLVKGVAKISATQASNQTCFLLSHQPKETEAVRKLRKF